MAPKQLNAHSTEDFSKKVLVVGDSGSGKTRFIGTFPKPIFIADFDGGLESLQGTPEVLYERYDGAEGWKQFRAELDRWCLQGPQYGCATFAVDSLSMLSDALLKAVLAKAGKPNGAMTIDNWGEAIRSVKDLLADLKVRLNCHSVVTAHLQVEKDELLGGLTWQPSIYGKELPGKVPAYFGEVYYTSPIIETQGGVPQLKYRLQVRPDQRVKFVKSNMNSDGKMFSTYEEPDFEKLIAKAHAHKENQK